MGLLSLLMLFVCFAVSEAQNKTTVTVHDSGILLRTLLSIPSLSKTIMDKRNIKEVIETRFGRWIGKVALDSLLRFFFLFFLSGSKTYLDAYPLKLEDTLNGEEHMEGFPVRFSCSDPKLEVSVLETYTHQIVMYLSNYNTRRHVELYSRGSFERVFSRHFFVKRKSWKNFFTLPVPSGGQFFFDVPPRSIGIIILTRNTMSAPVQKLHGWRQNEQTTN